MSLDVQTEDVGTNIGKERTSAQKNRIRHSNWLVTVSTNIRPQSNEESHRVGNDLHQSVKSMLTSENMPNIIDFKVDGDGLDKIETVRNQFGVELGRGKFGGAIHAHIIIHITHRSNIKLNAERIKEHIKNTTQDDRIQNIHINIAFKGSGKTLEQYIRKEQIQDKDVPV
jgi:hypothetical protein